MSNKPNYDLEVQRLYLEMFLSNAEYFMRCQNIFDPENFDQRLYETSEFILKYASEYKVMPEVEIVNASCRNNLNSVILPEEHYEWLLDEFERFSRHKALERAIIKSSDLLEEGDYAPVEKMIKDAVQISLTRDMGTDYFEDPKGRLNKLRESNGQISTGWPTVDKKIYGMNRGELNIFCAGSGGGKSLFLANLGVNWALAKLNVIYFSFELSEGLITKRLDSMTTGVNAKDIFRHLDDVDLKVKLLKKQCGHLQVKYFPSGKTCNDVRAYLREYQTRTGVKPDILLVDYLDLMLPITTKVSPENLYIKDKYVSEELRNLAAETNTIVVTAAQLGRSAVDELEFDHSHISGGLSKIQTADNVFGIFTSKSFKDNGKYQIQFMKTRSSSGVGHKIDLDFNIDTLRITDPEIDEDEPSFNQQRNSGGGMSSMLQGMKRTSTFESNEDVIPEVDPNAGVSASKVLGKPSNKSAMDIINGLNKINLEKD
jgi:hypothetical protein